MDFENYVSKMNTNELRLNLAKFLNSTTSDVVYITKHNKLIGEVKVFSEKEKNAAELHIARMMVAQDEQSRKLG